MNTNNIAVGPQITRRQLFSSLGIVAGATLIGRPLGEAAAVPSAVSSACFVPGPFAGMVVALSSSTISKLQSLSASAPAALPVAPVIDSARLNAFQNGTFFPTSLDLLSDGAVVSNLDYSYNMATDLKGNPILQFVERVDAVTVRQVTVNSVTSTVQETLSLGPSSTLGITLTGYGSGPASNPFANGFGLSSAVYTFGKQKLRIGKTKIVDFANLDSAGMASLSSLASRIDNFLKTSKAQAALSASSPYQTLQAVGSDDNLMFYLPPLVGAVSNVSQSVAKEANPCKLCTPTVITLAGIFWETGAGAFILGFCLGCELGGLF